LVARSENNVLGWAALSPTSSRDCYRGVVEVSIYVGNKYKSQGIGKDILTNLIKQSEQNGFWSLYSAIIKENSASIAIHKNTVLERAVSKKKPPTSRQTALKLFWMPLAGNRYILCNIIHIRSVIPWQMKQEKYTIEKSNILIKFYFGYS
jgi:L-amino acid N-acyltransferase YncA